MYNFLDRSIQSIQEASHSHKWTYSAEGFIISAYCTETEKAELCIYHGEQNAVKIETATKDKIYEYTDSDFNYRIEGSDKVQNEIKQGQEDHDKQAADITSSILHILSGED